MYNILPSEEHHPEGIHSISGYFHSIPLPLYSLETSVHISAHIHYITISHSMRPSTSSYTSTADLNSESTSKENTEIYNSCLYCFGTLLTQHVPRLQSQEIKYKYNTYCLILKSPHFVNDVIVAYIFPFIGTIGESNTGVYALDDYGSYHTFAYHPKLRLINYIIHIRLHTPVARYESNLQCMVLIAIT
jgi:hypothetical protein